MSTNNKSRSKTRHVKFYLERLEDRCVPSGGTGGSTGGPSVTSQPTPPQATVAQPSALLDTNSTAANPRSGNQNPSNGSSTSRGGPSNSVVALSGPGYPQVPATPPVSTSSGGTGSSIAPVLAPIQAQSLNSPTLALSPVLVHQPSTQPAKPKTSSVGTSPATPNHAATTSYGSSSAFGSASSSASTPPGFTLVGSGSGSATSSGSSSASAASSSPPPPLVDFGYGSQDVIQP